MIVVPLVGVVLIETPDTIVMQEGEAVARYSKRFYRLPNDQDKASSPIALYRRDKLPVKLTYGLHAILAPVHQ